ncbi:MAG TPA: DEAD/DEAH box helicase [Candidatus Limnocylindrales bacterium]|nr:DEAD/DEAH box helicase [Candidatus Limnocylindrales bacterium]
MTTTSFQELGVAEPLRRALIERSYTSPTPIQAQAIPPVLAGRDILGIAQTGTGKTAAFSLPLLQRLAEGGGQRPRPGAPLALILAPTRELAGQIADSIRDYGRHLGLRHTVIFGGVGQGSQVRALERGVHVLVATPGRLLDLIEQRYVRLSDVRILVLDEADRMFDMGFLRDLRKIVRLVPPQRQSLLFSATMPADIARLAEEVLRDPMRIEISPSNPTVDRVEQRVHFVDAARKRALLANLLEDPSLERVIVFTRTKHGANRVAEQLDRSGVRAEAIHGNKSQNARQRALDCFRKGQARVLVATDVAARGIDVVGVTHVINYEIPNEAESYVHRIGRTARAGAEGVAVSFCDPSERGYLRSIERMTGCALAVAETRMEALPVDPARGRREQPRHVKSFAPRGHSGPSRGAPRRSGRPV